MTAYEQDGGMEASIVYLHLSSWPHEASTVLALDGILSFHKTPEWLRELENVTIDEWRAGKWVKLEFWVTYSFKGKEHSFAEVVMKKKHKHILYRHDDNTHVMKCYNLLTLNTHFHCSPSTILMWTGLSWLAGTLILAPRPLNSHL